MPAPRDAGPRDANPRGANTRDAGSRGIRSRLLLLALATLLPVLTFAGLVAWRFAAAERAAVEREVLARAAALAREVDGQVQTVSGTLRALASSTGFQEADLPRLHGALVGVARVLGGPIAYRDEDGRLLLHSSLPPEAPQGETPLDAAFRAIPPDAPLHVGDLVSNPAGGAPVWGVIVPARDAAGRRRFLSVGLHPRALLDTLRAAAPGAGWTAAVVDRADRVILRTSRPDETIGLHSPSLREFAGRVWRTVNPDGTPVVAASAATGAGWVAGLSVPAATVDAPLHRALAALGAFGVAMIAAAVSLALVLGGRIARAVGGLEAAAAAVGSGGVPVPPRSGLRELDAVGGALTAAARTIAAREVTLADREAALSRTQRLARVGGFEVEVTHGPDGPRFRNIRSPEYLALHGLPPEAEGEPHEAWEGRIHRADRERVAAEFARAIAGTDRDYAQEYRIVTPRGERRWISARAEIQRDEAGRAVRVRGVHLDVTELRRAEALLRENEMALLAAEERLRLALEAGDLVAWEVDVARGVGTASAGHFRLLGIPGPSDGHSLLKDWERVVLAEDRPAQDAARRRAMEGDGVYDAEVRIRRSDGAIRWIASIGRRVSGTMRVIGVYADVTERKAAEETLRARVREAVAAAEAAQAALAQARKLEALGHLTGGVAHDFNNLLQVVAAGATLLRKRAAIAADPGALRLLDGVAGAAERGASLVARMLAFARRQEMRMAAVQPAELVDSLRDIVAKSVGPSVPVDFDPPGDGAAWWVRTDPNQLELALINLCVNARDAMPADRFPEGRVRVGLRHARATRAEEDGAPGPGEWVVLSVADSGAGMDGETLARATEPFFTTKEVGRGTGLGLSMVHGLCEQSGGALRLRSAPGRGTVAEMWLPRAPAPAVTDAPGDGPTAGAERGQERGGPGRRLAVLVVDDDPLVLSSTLALVADLGHAAMPADSAEAALALLRNGAQPDVVLTDHAMPGMTGLDLARRAVALRPDLPVILASGYADVPEGAASDLVRLDKPFSREALARALLEATTARVV